MTSAHTSQIENQTPDAAFRELRAWVDERLRVKGLLASGVPMQTRQEESAVTVEHIERLKADIEKLIKIEGRRNLWSGIAVSTVFFLLGLLAGAVSI
jgi:hypothetical protein